jgi:hypothetical protein
MQKTKIKKQIRNPHADTPLKYRYSGQALQIQSIVQDQQTSAKRFSSQLKVSLIIFGVFLAFVGISKLHDRLSAQTISEIRSGIGGYCLDVHDNSNAPNAKVDSWTCNDTGAQEWTVSNNKILHGNGDCLGTLGDSTQPETKVVVNKCNDSASQIWVPALGGYENTNSGLCLQVPNNTTNIPLEIGDCNHLTLPDETWTESTSADNTETKVVQVSCDSGTQGERVACYAAKELINWQSSPSTHEALLNDYTDGNSYEEWCADFISYVYKEAGYPFSQGERDGWDEYDANNIQYQGFTMHPATGYTPQAGDVAFFDYPGGHVELVAVGGPKPIFIYGDSATIDPATGNGDMAENSLTSDGNLGQLTYYLSPN